MWSFAGSMRRSLSSASVSGAYLWWAVDELARESLYDRKRRVRERVVGVEDIRGQRARARGTEPGKDVGRGCSVPGVGKLAEFERKGEEGRGTKDGGSIIFSDR